MSLTTKTKMGFYKRVMERLSEGKPISRRFCEMNKATIEEVFEVVRTQTKYNPRIVEWQKGDYIITWQENRDMFTDDIDRWLSEEMPKHELKRNEVKM